MSVRQDIYIKNEDKDEENFSKTSRSRTSISLINDEGNFNPNKNINE